MYDFKPYPNAVWDRAAVIGIFAFAAYLAFWESEPVLWVFAGMAIFSLVCGVFEALTRVYISSEGIRVTCGPWEPLPLTKWESFGAAYFLDISWSRRGKRVRHYYNATFLVLTKTPLDGFALEKVSRILKGTKPCGKWWGCNALRVSEEHMWILKSCIGDSIGYVEKEMDADFIIRL